MFSQDVRQFRIRHILLVLVIFAIAMGLVTTEALLTIQWGVLLLIAVGGIFFAYAAMFISDVLDSRRIDDRDIWSRMFNAIGLFLLFVTAVVILIFGAYVLFQTLLWFLQSSLFWLES